MDSQLLTNASPVGLDSVGANTESSCDFLGGQAVSNEPKNLVFSDAEMLPLRMNGHVVTPLQTFINPKLRRG